MTDQDAYRRYTAEAEAVLTKAAGNMGPQERFSLVALGNAWAQLALAAAQDRVLPAERPAAAETDQPHRVRDGEGDEWVRQEHGRYLLAFDRAHPGTTPLDLESIAARYGGYTEIP